MDTDKRYAPLSINQSHHKQTSRRLITLTAIFIALSIMPVLSQGPGEVPTSPNRNRPPATRTPITKYPRHSSPRQALQIEMILIPAGTFLMGSPAEKKYEYAFDEHPQHQVTVLPFYMGKYEVTQAQYRAVMGKNPPRHKGDYLPVTNVSWNDAIEFCRKLSEMTGKEYRLPTEAEWEYACRAGTTGDYAGNLDAMAWYSANYTGGTHPVGQKQPNAWGLYDMHGNVWEWCEDWYHKNYNGAPTDGSAWLSGGEQKWRVLRGGSWNSEAYELRSADRWSLSPDVDILTTVGFRVVADAR